MSERFGCDLARDVWLGVVASIVDRRALLLAATPHGEQYLFEFFGQRVRVVWIPQRAEVVTVMDMAPGASLIVARMTRNRGKNYLGDRSRARISAREAMAADE